MLTCKGKSSFRESTLSIGCQNSDNIFACSIRYNRKLCTETCSWTNSSFALSGSCYIYCEYIRCCAAYCACAHGNASALAGKLFAETWNIVKTSDFDKGICTGRLLQEYIRFCLIGKNCKIIESAAWGSEGDSLGLLSGKNSLVHIAADKAWAASALIEITAKLEQAVAYLVICTGVIAVDIEVSAD